MRPLCLPPPYSSDQGFEKGGGFKRRADFGGNVDVRPGGEILLSRVFVAGWAVTPLEMTTSATPPPPLVQDARRSLQGSQNRRGEK